MSHRFLSPEWFSSVARICQEAGDLGLPASVRETRIDFEVSDGPDGTIQAHIAGVAIELGFAEHASTRLRAPYDVAHQLLIGRDPGIAMRAYMAGQLKVEGDFSPLIHAYRASETPASRALLARIREITS